MSARKADDTTRGLLVAGLIIVAGLLLVGAFVTAIQSSQPVSRSGAVTAPPMPLPSAGPAVPPFSLERLQGGRLTLAELRGRVVVIDFWATWCPPCRAEMPWLVKMGQRLESKGVTFVAISEDDPPGQIPEVTAFSKEVPGLEKFAVLGDPDLEARYGVTSLPTLFIVDRQGRLVKRLVGAANEKTVNDLVETLAAAK
jgi:thiol-disulfide isomerase/thioredoxin